MLSSFSRVLAPRAVAVAHRAVFHRHAVAVMFQRRTKVIDVRRNAQLELWESYLKTGQGASALFDDLDLNCNGRISIKEINYFLESVNKEGVVREDAFQMLLDLGQDHELEEIEFRQWLSMAMEQRIIATDDSNKDDLHDVNVGKPSAIQNRAWDAYLSGENLSQNADNLFRTIDLDHSGYISVDEINFFLNSVGRRAIDEDEAKELMELGGDHELTESEFAIWLAGAVNPDCDSLPGSRLDGEGCTPQT